MSLNIWAPARAVLEHEGFRLRRLRYSHQPEPLILSELAALMGTDAPTISRIEWGNACPDYELGLRLTAWIDAQERLQTSESDEQAPSAMTAHIVSPTPPRATHPDTSRRAMDSINRDNAWAIHNWIIEQLEHAEMGLTHEQMWTEYSFEAWDEERPRSSQSGLRTRVSELVRGGVIQDSGRTRTMTTGRQAIVWELADTNRQGSAT